MAIPSIDAVKKSVIAKEIEPFEAKIIAHLETVSNVSYAENADIPVKPVLIVDRGGEISEPGILALMESIEAGGYTDVDVKNTRAPKPDGLGSSANPTPAEKQVEISFKIPTTKAGGSTPAQGGGSTPSGQ